MASARACESEQESCVRQLPGPWLSLVYKILTLFMLVFFCKSSIQHSGSSDIGICQKCNTAQRLFESRITAKLVLQNQDGNRITVRGYTSTLSSIVQGNQITIEQLLMAPQFDVEYNAFHVMQSIHRH